MTRSAGRSASSRIGVTRVSGLRGQEVVDGVPALLPAEDHGVSDRDAVVGAAASSSGWGSRIGTNGAGGEGPDERVLASRTSGEIRVRVDPAVQEQGGSLAGVQEEIAGHGADDLGES